MSFLQLAHPKLSFFCPHNEICDSQARLRVHRLQRIQAHGQLSPCATCAARIRMQEVDAREREYMVSAPFALKLKHLPNVDFL